MFLTGILVESFFICRPGIESLSNPLRPRETPVLPFAGCLYP